MPQSNRWRLKLIADKLKAGAVIAYPTEGVWGLGCVPQDQVAVEKLLRLKRRSWTKGLILVASEIDQILPYCLPLTSSQLDELNQNWPGPITYLIPKSDLTPQWISGESDKVAVRVTDHPQLKELCDKLGGPLVSTSANPAGKKPATNALQLKQYFANELDLVVSGKLGGQTGASEIRDLVTGAVVRAKNK